jgi:hypothetical protein
MCVCSNRDETDCEQSPPAVLTRQSSSCRAPGPRPRSRQSSPNGGPSRASRSRRAAALRTSSVSMRRGRTPGYSDCVSLFFVSLYYCVIMCGILLLFVCSESAFATKDVVLPLRTCSEALLLCAELRSATRDREMSPSSAFLGATRGQLLAQTDRQTDRQTDTNTNTNTHTHTHTHTHTQTDRPIDRQTDRQTDRQIHRKTRKPEAHCSLSNCSSSSPSSR